MINRIEFAEDEESAVKNVLGKIVKRHGKNRYFDMTNFLVEWVEVYRMTLERHNWDVIHGGIGIEVSDGGI